MKIRTLSVLVALCAVAACSDRAAPAPSAPAPATVEQPSPVPTAGPLPGPAPASASPIPVEVVVSTNEPFWQARVQGSTLVLAGPEGERRFAVESNEATAEGRHVGATDAKGRVELQVTPQPCEDDMSGAAFPYTGSVSIDGAAAARGCARPASSPIPQPAD